MILFNNRYISKYRVIFVFVDTVLLLGAVAIAYYLRFLIEEFPFTWKYFLIRSFFFVFVFELFLYYFELCDLRIIRDSAKLCSRLIQVITGALIFLTLAYYTFPVLRLGRGVFLFSIILATSAAFFVRIIYRRLVSGNHLNERIIILGTGEFAREIAREIRKKGDSGFEVIGHIDENRGFKDEKHVA